MARTPSGPAARFSCPPNFTAALPVSEPTRFSLEVLTGPDTELWLIQAPADFAPNCLNGRLVPLSGSRIVKGKVEGKRHRYRVLSSSGPQAGKATLLAPSAEAGGELTCAPAVQGNLRIFEGPQESLSGTALQPIPANPAPQVPPGLRPRFCAFGGSPPVTGPGSAWVLKPPASRKKKKKKLMPEVSVPHETMNGHGALEVDVALGSAERDGGKKKKKRPLNELQVMEQVATEPTAEMLEPAGGLFPSTTKKKKKPKEAETVEQEVGAAQEREEKAELELIKTEPQEDTLLSPAKKRKKQKRTEGVEPAEGTGAESQLQVMVKPQEEALPLPSSKKKKKEKGYSVMVGTGPEALEPEMRSLELHRDMREPDLPPGVGPQDEATPVSTKKRRKKERGRNGTAEAGAGTAVSQEVMAPEQPDGLEPHVTVASPKKKKDRGHRVTEPGTEVTDPPGEMMEPEVKADLASTKKKRKRGQESGVLETVPQVNTPEPLLNLESGEVVPTGREKKRKKQLQRSPM